VPICVNQPTPERSRKHPALRRSTSLYVQAHLDLSHAVRIDCAHRAVCAQADFLVDVDVEIEVDPIGMNLDVDVVVVIIIIVGIIVIVVVGHPPLHRRHRR
jgi:hypothetical protein